MIKNLVKTRLPTGFGDFSLYLYLEGGKEHLALVKGDVSGSDPVPVRVHSECLTGDVFGSRRCDCGDQLKHTLMYLGRQEAGILIYLRQEGRGIGLLKKMEAYNLQDQGLDTVEANIQLGHQPDERDYGIAARILRDLGVSAIRLITNNPHKVEALENHGIVVIARIPIEVGQHEENLGYLKSKAERMAHLLRFRERMPADHDFAFMEPLLDQLALARHADQQRPFVTLAYAQSLDGAALAPTENIGDRSRDHALKDYLLSHHDAILLTEEAFLRDWNGSLLRHAEGPLIAVLDPNLRLGSESFDGLVAHDRCLVITASPVESDRADRLESQGFRVKNVGSEAVDLMDPTKILDMLSAEGIRSVLVFGGEETIGPFLVHHKVDYCVITLVPCFAGGGVVMQANSRGLPHIQSCTFHALGSDLIAFGALSYPASSSAR